MSVAYIDTLVIEFDNCFGSIKMMQPLLGGNTYHPRYTKIKAKRAAKIERYIWRARGNALRATLCMLILIQLIRIIGVMIKSIVVGCLEFFCWKIRGHLFRCPFFLGWKYLQGVIHYFF